MGVFLRALNPWTSTLSVNEMLLTEEQLEERLNSENNLANRFSGGQVVTLPRRGKKEGERDLTVEERTEIATRARLGEGQKFLAKEFRVDQATISRIENGKSRINESEVESRIEKVRDLALERLMTSLGFMTNDKLEKCSAKDLSTIAANMSRAVEKTGPREGNNNTQVIIYAPEIRKETSFKVVEI